MKISIQLDLSNRMRINVEVRIERITHERIHGYLGEELLRKIRERHAKRANKESDDVPGTTSTTTTTQLLVPPV